MSPLWVLQLLHWSEVSPETELVVFSTLLAFQHLHCWADGELMLPDIIQTFMKWGCLVQQAYHGINSQLTGLNLRIAGNFFNVKNVEMCNTSFNTF